MSNFPKVIGFIPAYNAEKFIHSTLEALAKQTYPNFEIWICNDASKDNTSAVCQAFCEMDQRFKFFENEVNQGWWKTSQHLWTKSSEAGDYCFFQPHDDLPNPDFISVQIDLLEQNPEATLAVPGIKNTYPNGKSFDTIISGLGTDPSPAERIIPLVKSNLQGWWAAIHGIHRSKFIPKVNPVNYLRFGEKEFALDLIWLIKLASHGPFVCTEKVLFEKFYSDQSLSGGWKHNFKNRVSLYLAISEEVVKMSISPVEKLKIFGAIFEKTFGSVKSRLKLPK